MKEMKNIKISATAKDLQDALIKAGGAYMSPTIWEDAVALLKPKTKRKNRTSRQ